MVGLKSKSARPQRKVIAVSNGTTSDGIVAAPFDVKVFCMGMHSDGSEPPVTPVPADGDFDVQHVPLLSQVGDNKINVPFDRYLLLRQLGEGAMGTVYEAKQNEPARTVAVKIMKSKQSSSAAAEGRFLRETRLLATLNHPHVAQLYDAGVHHHGVLHVPFCVMELVRGASSITVFAQSKRLSTKAKIELFLQVCAGVRHAHEQGVIHCDLKPSNILVNGEGQVKVIDFGVARSMQLDESTGTSWSDASVIFGTPQYMSPEQVSGHDFELDQRSDVYALGVILYELLCGHLPYKVDRTSSVTAAKSILESDPTTPRKHNRSLRGDVEKILDKALVKDADSRYQTVRALEDDLQLLLRGEPVSPDRRRIYRARRKGERWIARHRLLAVAVSLIVASIFCGTLSTRIATRGLNFAFELLLTQNVHHVPSAPLSHVVIVKLRDGTDIAAIAGTKPSDGPEDALHPRFARRAHGQFLKRLAQAGVRPRAVTFDIRFPPESKWDLEFADGIRASSGVPIIVGAYAGTSDSPLEPILAPALRPLVSAGGTNGLMRADGPWTADLATTLPNGGIYPSLALMTASRCWRPEQMPAMEWLPDAIQLRYAEGGTRRVDVTSVAPMPDENLELGLRKGTPFAEFVIEVPDDHDLERSSLDYRDVFSMSDADLRDRLDGNVLLIGDFRQGADGPFAHPDGRSMPGAIMQAVAIERLLSGEVLKRPRYISASSWSITGEIPIVVSAAVAGAIAAIWLRDRSWTRVTAYLVVSIAIVLSTLLAFRVGGFIYLPLAPVLCVVVAGELVLRIYRARESTI
ncbi:MAG: protein kinase [Anaerolineae bacterium]|nr:protein kinase [Phycisphaerae bacterium]